MEHVAHLQKDKKLAPIVQPPFCSLTPKKNIAIALMGSIMSQQLSTKVAAVIYARFLALYQHKIPTVAAVLNTPINTLRSIGLSNAKAMYIHNVAQFFIEQKITPAYLKKLSNEEIIALLTQIKGVGQWTVEMLLMFTIGREDLIALDDLGIQQAIVKLYKLEHLNKKELKLKMNKIAVKWSPFRTYACLYLWRWKDGK